MSVSIALGQAENLVLCYQKQAYLVNGETVISLSKCDKKNWIVPLQIESGEIPKQIKPTRRERQISELLQKVNTVNLKETKINELNFTNFLKEGKRETSAKVFLNSFSEEKQKLLTRKEMMEFIISEGFLQGGKYNEVRRFTVKLAGTNPKIGDILEEVKKEFRKDPRRTNFDNLLLSKYGTWEPLDEEKTITDYDIKNQDLIRLSSKTR